MWDSLFIKMTSYKNFDYAVEYEILSFFLFCKLMNNFELLFLIMWTTNMGQRKYMKEKKREGARGGGVLNINVEIHLMV